jgi:hypothetical protein
MKKSKSEFCNARQFSPCHQKETLGMVDTPLHNQS